MKDGSRSGFDGNAAEAAGGADIETEGGTRGGDWMDHLNPALGVWNYHGEPGFESLHINPAVLMTDYDRDNTLRCYSWAG